MSGVFYFLLDYKSFGRYACKDFYPTKSGVLSIVLKQIRYIKSIYYKHFLDDGWILEVYRMV